MKAEAQILKAKVQWAFDFEITRKPGMEKFAGQFSGVDPLHEHSGLATLTPDRIEISGDMDLLIPLTSITQLYLGFDEIYQGNYVKNFGIFWQPLRLKYDFHGINTVYLVLDYNFIFSKNEQWYNALKQLLSS